MDDLIRQSATEAARALRARAVSSEELVHACLARIEEVNPLLNAVVQVDAAAALARAREADAALARGQLWGELHGVPMTIKDSFDTAGVISTAGTTGRKSHIPKRDATIVARLKAAGAILLGKTNVPEITLRFATDNFVYGRTNNPYDLDRIPAGSSGGAAAAVASCCTAFDIGSDTGGSIRIPAHFCGIAGLKPTAGRVPRTGHTPFLEFGAAETLTQVGPLTRRVEDFDLLLRIIAGPDAVDPGVIPVPLGDPAVVQIEALRVAWYTEIELPPAPTRETVETTRNAAAALASAGAAVAEAAPPGVQSGPGLWRELFAADGGATVRALLARLGTTRMHPFLQWTQQGREIPASEYAALLASLNELRSAALGFMESHDVIISPVNATPATVHDEPTPFRFTYLYNLLGWPVAVVRCSTSPEGLPLGVQIIARPWREDIVLAVAGFLEQTFGGWREPLLAKPTQPTIPDSGR